MAAVVEAHPGHHYDHHHDHVHHYDHHHDHVRDLDADVLREYPGLCFSSTNLNFYVPGMSWTLHPYCGVASCVQGADGSLLERVTDCGPQPKTPLPQGCTIANLRQLQDNSTVLSYPKCCAQFECPEGVRLEYPTEQELQQRQQRITEGRIRMIK